MAIIKVDTVKLRECGNDIIAASSMYDSNINKLFNRMGDVPSKTKEWEGISAIKYANLVVKEKNDYIEFGKGLYDLGNSLVLYADDLEKIIVENRRKLEDYDKN